MANGTTAHRPFFRDMQPICPPLRTSNPSAPARRRPEPVPDARVHVFVEGLNEAQQNTLNRLTCLETRRLGYEQVRVGGPVWEKARRTVIENLIRNEVDIDEIELPDEAAQATHAKSGSECYNGE